MDPPIGDVPFPIVNRIKREHGTHNLISSLDWKYTKTVSLGRDAVIGHRRFYEYKHRQRANPSGASRQP